MIAAYRLKGIGWFGGCVVVTLGFYLVSLQVAAERKKLETMNGRIALAQRDIRSLETEFDTRANLTQLERWNGDTLALAAPQVGQFVADEAQLAALDAHRLPDDGAQMKAAALVVPSMPAAMAVMPAPVAVAVAAARPAPARPAQAKSRVAAAVMVAAVKVRSALPARAAMAKVVFTPSIERAAATMRPAVVLRAKPEVALLDRKLLSDQTLGDLLSGARVEKGHRR